MEASAVLLPCHLCPPLKGARPQGPLDARDLVRDRGQVRPKRQCSEEPGIDFMMRCRSCWLYVTQWMRWEHPQTVVTGNAHRLGSEVGGCTQVHERLQISADALE